MNLLLFVDQVQKYYPVSRGLGAWWCKPQRSHLYAVDDVSFGLEEGESLGLVGESASGKSSLVHLIARLIDPSTGRIVFDGQEISRIPARQFAHLDARAQIQVVFQNAANSLNPRLTVFDCIAEPLRCLQRISSRHELLARVADAVDRVGLSGDLLTCLPHQLTLGQRVCVHIARAISLRPRLLMLDEPTAGLDASVQAMIVQCLGRLRRDLGMTYIVVSRDLHVVRLLCDRIMVMYQGKIAEVGMTEDIFQHPLHPYTQALVSALPDPYNRQRFERITLYGEPHRPVDPNPDACRLSERCPKSQILCGQAMPVLRRYASRHLAACHGI
ncbi:MAG: hypothetical protein ETSY1_29080 [Candidatus Entotheonella factor]|uniref:ABC transporter domain-containing protein n=1 Tax=Entotheonella factor TaxID=1429438 RepID=W4LCN1_ENTF1|nr:ABC transporter ATP-binding protein [Candidatus Entotheonella palauensis]ETW95818.1 MAG: hypothetical protein ETSY1_29080 [Candidatus Entotheonella factor]